MQKINKRTTAGNEDNVCQIFVANRYFDYREYLQKVSFSDNSVVRLTGPGAEPDNYIYQDSRSVFTNFSSPCLNYTITADSGTLTSTTIIQEIYKLDFETWDNYVRCYNEDLNSSNISQSPFQSTNSNETSTETETITDTNGISTTRQIQRTLSTNRQASNVNLQSCPTLTDIEYLLNNPIAIYTANTTAITAFEVSISPDELVKDLKTLVTERLFENKSQYLINTKVIFPTNERQYDNFSYYDTNGNLINTTPSSTPNTQTVSTYSPYKIKDGPAKGMSVIGSYFVYFVIPPKPVIEAPIVEGDLNTYTPKFYWSNSDGYNHQLLQITYITSDTGFTGTVFTYDIINANSVNNSEISDGNNYEEIVQTSETIKTYSVPLQSNKEFRYRIGNVEEISPNIFNTTQRAVVFSDSFTAKTKNTRIANDIYIYVDSPYGTSSVDAARYTQSEDLTCFVAGTIVFSGDVSGSIVTGATVQLIAPTGNYITTTTDLNGYFEVPGLTAGIYTVNTFYRGYAQDTRTIDLPSSGLTMEIKLKILWSNSYDTFGKMAMETFNY